MECPHAFDTFRALRHTLVSHNCLVLRIRNLPVRWKRVNSLKQLPDLHQLENGPPSRASKAEVVHFAAFVAFSICSRKCSLRSCRWLYTVDIIFVSECPASSAICAIGTPASKPSVTKACRRE